MPTWDELKEKAKKNNPEAKAAIEDGEKMAEIIGEIISKRNELGLSQRDLAAICDLPQSSVARIEAFLVTPRIDTLLAIMRPLGLTLKVTTL